MNPRVSVVVPTRNRRRTLERALASVAAQAAGDLEVIVVVDGSTDGTAGWLAARHPGVRVAVLDPPRGAAAARNHGVAQARGELIAFLDDDDWWLPGYLATQVACLDANPHALLSHAEHLEVSESGATARPDTAPLLRYERPLARLLAESFIHTMSVAVVRRSAFEQYGGLDPDLTIVHDLEWYARLLAGGEAFIRAGGGRPLVARTVPGGLVTDIRRWRREERAVIDRVLARAALAPSSVRLVRAYRALFFAHLASSRGQLGFGLARLLDALRISPRWTLRVAWRRVRRRLPRGVAACPAGEIAAP